MGIMRRWIALLIPGFLLFWMPGCSHDRQPPSAGSTAVSGHSAAFKPAAAPAAVTPRQASADQRPVIVAFGDSLSAGYGAPAGESYPDYLQQILNHRKYPYHIVNLGVSGNTTTDGLERLDSVLALKPNIVILELGGNDGLRGIPVSDTRANLETMIIELRKAGIKVVLAGMTLPPNYGPDYIHSFQAVYQDLARQNRVTLIPFLLEDIVPKVRSQPGLMQADGIHPTAAGNRIVADTVFRYLQPLLKHQAG